jgi:hypothetical protein
MKRLTGEVPASPLRERRMVLFPAFADILRMRTLLQPDDITPALRP